MLVEYREKSKSALIIDFKSGDFEAPWLVACQTQDPAQGQCASETA